MNSFNARSELKVQNRTYEIYNPAAVPNGAALPRSKKILLENLLRFEDGAEVSKDDIQAVLDYKDGHKDGAAPEIAYRPARVLMQDFTGVPVVADLAVMRDTMRHFDKDPSKINPLQPVDLVIDHSVQVDTSANAGAYDLNTGLEYKRNKERYTFLKWAQKSFSNFNVVPPGSGIVHQVNIEHLARLVFTKELDKGGVTQAYPDTLVGTDSHTTMINGIGVLGWGVGGIEAEASMLGQSISMLIPKVVSMKLTGSLEPGVMATDLVLTIVELLRAHGVVGKFVEFQGDGVKHLTVGDRATIANMAPEYGATCGFFPVDEQTINYMRLTARSDDHIALIEKYAQETGLWLDDSTLEYDEHLELDLGSVQSCLAGPKRPQDRVLLKDVPASYEKETNGTLNDTGSDTGNKLSDGAVVIAAITSCTNTSNPSVMLAAGLLARNAAERGLKVKPWVKTSLAPGSRVVTRYLEDAGLMEPLQSLGFHVVGYGCTTCIGNSGPLDENISQTIEKDDIIASAVLSGNRNFEGRIHPLVRLNYLASPPLVIAYALAGHIQKDLVNAPIGEDDKGQAVYLKDIWPDSKTINELESRLSREQFSKEYATIYDGDENWRALDSNDSELCDWSEESTYVVAPPYFDGMGKTPTDAKPIKGARALAMLGDSITTDHISPAGAIAKDSPAGLFLNERGVSQDEFNSYGSRRGNHEVMMRGTFANIRLQNLLAANERKGGWTTHIPTGEEMTIYDAAQQYKTDDTPVIVIAGKEYGSGSSRDWAAKGPMLLGVRAIIAESYERIHRSNLVGMGILPLQFMDGDSAKSLGLDGREIYDFDTGANGKMPSAVKVTATDDSGNTKTFEAKVRIDTPVEHDYFRHGGILPFVMRGFLQ